MVWVIWCLTVFAVAWNLQTPGFLEAVIVIALIVGPVALISSLSRRIRGYYFWPRALGNLNQPIGKRSLHFEKPANSTSFLAVVRKCWEGLARLTGFVFETLVINAFKN